MEYIIFHRSGDSFGKHKAPCFCTTSMLNRAHCPDCEKTGLTDRWGFEFPKVLLNEDLAIKEILPYVHDCSYVTSNNDPLEIARFGSVTAKDTATKLREAIKARIDFHSLCSIGMHNNGNPEAHQKMLALRSVLDLMNDLSRAEQGLAWITTKEIEVQINKNLKASVKHRSAKDHIM